MARRCIFCGGGDLTKEHAYPGWILREQDLLGISVHSHGEHLRTLIGPDAAIEFKYVCGKCNNGWMSHLEDDAKALLSLLISGQPTRLNSPEQLLLGTWLVKTAMVFGCAQPKKVRFYTPAECDQLRVRAMPPNSVEEIIIGHYRGTARTLFSQGYGLSGVEEHEGFEAYLFTILVGKFVGQVLAMRNEPRDGRFLANVRSKSKACLPIMSPFGAIDWPPATSFTDGEGEDSLIAFAERSVNGLIK